MFLQRIVARTALAVVGIALAASVAMADNLVIYSPQGAERGAWIVEQAKAAGLQIDIINGGGGELFDRLLAERNNPQADVVLHLVDTSMALLKKEGLFQPFTPAWAEGLPAVNSDPDGIVFKYGYTPIVLAYNADRMRPAEAPKSWLDLAKPQYKGKFVIGNVAWQTTRVYLAGMLARFLDDKGEISPRGWEFMRGLYANALLTNDADAKTQMYKTGQAVIDLNWFGGALKQANDVGYAATVIDTEGGTPVISEGVAILKATRRLDQAKAFVNWWGSADFQAAYAARYNQAPAHPAALAKSPAKIQADAKLLRAQPINWDVIAPKLDGWLQKIELEIR